LLIKPRNASWRSEVTVRTWPSPPTLAKAERQIVVEDDSGEIAVCAKAEWCALDYDTRKIRKLSTITCYPFNMEHKTEKAFEGGFINITEKPLVILDVITSCSCTKVSWRKKPIPAQSVDELELSFTAETEGVFFKKVAIRHSEAQKPVSFTIKGVVTPRKK
jgi:hypothetical protein